jgi:myosin heavy subunit
MQARVLTQRVQVGNRDSIHIKQLNATDVAHNIHALIKWIYSSLFTYIIKKVNFSHCSTVRSDAKAASFVGILDIFGFEVLGVNSLEQLCINYTNECLQQLFYQHVFDREQALYAGENHCVLFLFSCL